MMRCFGSRGSVIDAKSDYIDCIVYCIYGCSIADANSEVSESEMNLFWSYLPHPHPLSIFVSFGGIIADEIFEFLNKWEV